MSHVDAFLKHLTERQFRYATIAAYRSLLERFTDYCIQCGVSDVAAIGRKEARGFIEALAPRDRMTLAGLRSISRICTYFRFLEQQGLIFESPLRGYVPPEAPKTHYAVLTEKEMMDILAHVSGTGRLSVKGRAMLELAYSSALRPRELYNLKRSDIDFGKELLFLELSKGGKDRLVPVGRQALSWVRRYIGEVRPRYLKGKFHGYVFVSHKTGEPLTVYGIRWAIQESLRRAGLPPIKTYSLRGSAATHLLLRGMGALPISKLLGHQSIRTTLYYLRIPLLELRKELSLKHPRRRMEESLKKEKGQRR